MCLLGLLIVLVEYVSDGNIPSSMSMLIKKNILKSKRIYLIFHLFVRLMLELYHDRLYL